jgi:MarR family transcriptional regulator for hemolysin
MEAYHPEAAVQVSAIAQSLLRREFLSELLETSRLVRNYVERRAKERGTTRAQWIVLWRLRENEGLSQVDLADVLEIKPISLVALLDRLVEQHLLERRPDPSDRRAKRVYLTELGRSIVDGLDDLRDQIAGEISADMDPNSMRTSLEALKHVKRRAKNGNTLCVVDRGRRSTGP